MGDFLYANINMLSGFGNPDFYYRKRCNSAWSGLSSDPWCIAAFYES